MFLIIWDLEQNSFHENTYPAWIFYYGHKRSCVIFKATVFLYCYQEQLAILSLFIFYFPPCACTPIIMYVLTLIMPLRNSKNDLISQITQIANKTKGFWNINWNLILTLYSWNYRLIFGTLFHKLR